MQESSMNESNTFRGNSLFANAAIIAGHNESKDQDLNKSSSYAPVFSSEKKISNQVGNQDLRLDLYRGLMKSNYMHQLQFGLSTNDNNHS